MTTMPCRNIETKAVCIIKEMGIIIIGKQFNEKRAA